MTPDSHVAAPEAPESGAVWLSVAQTAAVLGVSQKTVRKRIASGDLTARRVSQKRGGIAFLVCLEREVETPEMETEVEAKRPRSGNRDGSEKTSNEREKSEVETEMPSKGKRDGNRSGSEVEVELRDSLASERAQNAFLRSTIEQLQRDGAETRAALREALKIMPKQLTSGAAESAPETPTATAKAPGVVSPAKDTNGPEIAAQSPKTATYGDLADWLEAELKP